MATSKKRKRADDEPASAGVQRQHGTKRTVKMPKTKQAKTSKPLGEDLFRKLPGELRNRIYDLVLLEERTYMRRTTQRRFQKVRAPIQVHSRGPGYGERASRWKEPGLLRASKWIRNEAKAVYYQGNIFAIQASTSDVRAACDWIRSTVQGFEIEDQSFNLESFSITKCKWADIRSWLSLAQIVRDLDVGFGVHNQDTNYDGNIGYPHCTGIDRAFYEIAALGLEAATGEWDDLTLEMAFEEWIDRTMRDRQKFFKGRIRTSKRIDCGMGKVQRRMRKIEYGHVEENEDAGGLCRYVGRGKGVIKPMTMQLRSES
ncbi:hypothetical protein LTR36_000881 [Oleoguttula mirabilis]|uniref:2EXR domain-containing protein n=1 Tax=Oleoguttula mirabilis TaxID=1507867 RepID=A0AAV9J3M6_9PEZI|nr:hypothetical protein LTR36_000881 [Oleoguttula mirabilis]